MIKRNYYVISYFLEFAGISIHFLCRRRYAGGQETEKAESFQNEEEGRLKILETIKYCWLTI